MSTSNGALVRVKDAEKVFHRGSEEIHVLSGLNLEVPKGEFLALMAEDPARAQALAAGVATSVAAVAKSATDSTSGSVALAIQGRDATIKDLGSRLENWDSRLMARKAALQRQFSAMETALSSLKNQSSWLAGQLAAQLV